jgi:hypothetical protein
VRLPNRLISEQRTVRSRSEPGTSSADQPGSVMNVVVYSVYHDQLVKSDSVWRFARRTGRPVYVERGALSGDGYRNWVAPSST